MRRSAQLTGATIRRHISFVPTADQWATLSAIVPDDLLEGDRDVLTDLVDRYLVLAEAEDVAPTKADAEAKVAAIGKAAKGLQEALSFGSSDASFDVANQVSTLMDDKFDVLAARRGAEPFRLHAAWEQTILILEAVDLAKRDLALLAPAEGPPLSQKVLFLGLKEFFEDHRWPVSFTYDGAPSDDRHPALVRFASTLLRLLPSHQLVAEHHELASLGRRMSRACASA